MAYSDFTLAKVKSAFGLTTQESGSLFASIPAVPPSPALSQTLTEFTTLATSIGTEKARSEFLIAPILAEVRRQMHYRIALFSGVEFNVDAARGLQGFCDFILSASAEQLYIEAPVMTVVEAKREDIIGGLGQCIATMVAAQIFNVEREQSVPRIYGAVTSGTNWRFLMLEGTTVWIDSLEYYISQIGQILGILMQPFQPDLVGSATP
ncbi:hypothetical protein P7L53_14720 [Thermoleptolyngbya sichuanensis XZ-Cy5]|uniref:hypothetical protein n=1 Tax=Thermoleptolyngbya sichuanensis TaxID=2885951 RepID=UPI00240E7837|nr:hypothetical protein [Thermoleptolyngbya sichuanensis]MDG2617491.1 hypothetical protein [Thermoleptolyngbya sichuanensis XZ-Cy5]